MTVKQPHIYFAMPCYGGLIYEACFTSMLKFSVASRNSGIDWSVDTMVNESLIPRGRNNLVAKFLHCTAATHLMFIDADIRWNPEYMTRLLKANKDVVCGMYPMKCIPPRFVINAIQGGEQEGTLEEVATAGTGFMLIKRECIETMIAAYPETKYNDNIGVGAEFEPFMYALFDTMIDDKQNYLSEDWAFCHRWRQLGNKVWVDKSIILDHQGTYAFKGADAVAQLLIEQEKAKNADAK